MNEALGTALIFVLIFIVVPWGLIFALRLVGRRHGDGSPYAPSQGAPPTDRPLRCRLNLFHRWRTLRTRSGAATNAARIVGGPVTSRWPLGRCRVAVVVCRRSS